MAIDPSIILSVKPAQFQMADPLESASKSLSLQALMGQRDMQGMQLDEARRGAEANQRLQALFSSNPNATPEDVMRIDPVKGMKFRQDALNNRKTESEINASRAKATRTLLETQRDLMTPVFSDPTPDNALAAIDRFGAMAQSLGMPEFATSPQIRAQLATASPEQIRKFAQGLTITAEKMLPNYKEVNDGKTTRFVDTNSLSNPNVGAQTIAMLTTPGQDQVDARTRAEGAANRGVQIRGQNMTDARARETLAAGRWANDLANGVQVNMATGETRPITVNGQPIQKEPKLTEDQGKATGWLVQADNAYKNMISAVKATGGEAARAGLPDMVAGISGPFGVGEGAAKSAANMMRGEERQKFLQAAESLSESLLRAATGAGVNRDEAAQKVRELTPQIGDSDAVIKQKTEAIPLYIESLKVRAGPGAAKLPTIIQNAAPSNPQESVGKIRMPTQAVAPPPGFKPL